MTSLLEEAQRLNDEDLKDKKLIKLREILRRREIVADEEIRLVDLETKIIAAKREQDLPIVNSI